MEGHSEELPEQLLKELYKFTRIYPRCYSDMLHISIFSELLQEFILKYNSKLVYHFFSLLIIIERSNFLLKFYFSTFSKCAPFCLTQIFILLSVSPIMLMFSILV